MSAAETQPPLTLSQKILALLLVGMIGVGVVSLLPAALSCMILDAPGSEQRLAPVALMFSILSFPIACFYAARKAITQLRRDRLRAGYFWLLLPMVNVAVAAAAIAWMELFQSGKFNGSLAAKRPAGDRASENAP